MQKRNIITAMVAVAALIMVVIVFIVKSNLNAKDDATTGTTAVQTELYTSMVEMSSVDENGDVYYYTMVQTYSRPSKSSNYVYPTTKSNATTTGTTGPQYTVITEYIYSYDEDGNIIKDESGNPVTEVVTHTELITTTTTTAPYVEQTAAVTVTNPDGTPAVDASGVPITAISVLNPTTAPPTTTKPRYPSITLPSIDIDLPVDSDAGDSIVSKINDAREAQGLEPLEVSVSLRGEAITRSSQLARKSDSSYAVSGKPVSYPSASSADAVSRCLTSSGSSALSADYTQIGVGVVKFEGQYYTTIVYK